MKLQRILPVFFALALLGACKSTTTPVYEDIDVGIMQGKVTANNVQCQPVNAAGIKVQIEGTTFSTSTDSSGNWSLNNIPAGIYNIALTKSGFDTSIISQDQFSGAGTQFLENGTIAEIPMDSVPVVSVTIDKSDSIVAGLRDSEIFLGKGRDTFVSYYASDTIGVVFSLKIALTMQGQDSAISFTPTIKDISRLNKNVYFWLSFPEETLVKNGNLTLTGTIISNYDSVNDPQGGFNSSWPIPGDTILITTVPSGCQGQRGPVFSKEFILN